MGFCAKCGKEVDDSWKICGNCGAKLEQQASSNPKQKTTCPSCGAEIQADWKICGSCGTKLGPTSLSQPKQPAPPSSPPTPPAPSSHPQATPQTPQPTPAFTPKPESSLSQPEKKSSKKKLLVLAVLAIGVLVIGGGLLGALFLFGGSDTDGGDDIVCDAPYIQAGDECCLDEDENGICDSQTSGGSATTTTFLVTQTTTAPTTTQMVTTTLASTATTILQTGSGGCITQDDDQPADVEIITLSKTSYSEPIIGYSFKLGAISTDDNKCPNKLYMYVKRPTRSEASIDFTWSEDEVLEDDKLTIGISSIVDNKASIWVDFPCLLEITPPEESIPLSINDQRSTSWEPYTFQLEKVIYDQDICPDSIKVTVKKRGAKYKDLYINWKGVYLDGHTVGITRSVNEHEAKIWIKEA